MCLASSCMSTMGSMKVHHLTRALWEQHEPSSSSPSLSLGCKRLRPLAPKLPSSAPTSPTTPFDLKTFIRPDSGPRKPSDDPPRDSPPQVYITCYHY